MRKLLVKSYSILLLFLASCIVIYVDCLKNICHQWAKDLSLSFLTNLSTVILVAIVVDYIAYIYQEKEKQRLKKIAFITMKYNLKQHFEFLFKMFKASVKSKPIKTSVKLTDFFDEQYYLEIGFLDLSKNAPIYTPEGKIDWLDYTYSECIKFKNSLDQNLDRYGSVLDSETIGLIEKSIDSPFIKLVGNLQVAKNIKGSGFGYIVFRNFFEQKGIKEDVKSHIDLFLNLIYLYNKNVSIKDKFKIDLSEWENLWDNHYAPHIGDSRI